jgi:hypothetical protein
VEYRIAAIYTSTDSSTVIHLRANVRYAGNDVQFRVANSPGLQLAGTYQLVEFHPDDQFATIIDTADIKEVVLKEGADA